MYKALYRQYRPRTFSDLVGQTVIAQTLENALKSNKVGHAYLFAGPRGTGKTSVAKIFAREIEGIPDDTDRESFSDIIEIDAASNNGVDEIRNLRDAANYAPIEYQFKIYIIDEVHMLSTGAFNALLKTIEEPPAQVKFILATTEPQKIPATILSRVQRFDFHRIDVDQIVKRLEFVLDDQKIAYDPAALKIVANASDGGLRDALSILDQAVAITKTGRVELDDVFKITGTSPIDQQIGFLQHVLEKQTAKAFKDIHKLLLDGKDPIRFAEDLLVLLKNLMLIKIAPELVSENAFNQIENLSKEFSNSVFEQAIDDVSDNLMKMKQTTRPELYLEILAVKIASRLKKVDQKAIQAQTPSPAKTEMSSSAVLVNSNASSAESMAGDFDNHPQAQVDIAEKNEKSNQMPESTEKPASQNEEPLESPSLAKTDDDSAWQVMEAAVKSELQAVKDAWPDIVADFDESVAMLAENSEPVAASQKGLIISFNHPELAEAAARTPDFVAKLSESLLDLLGVKYQLVFISEADWVTLRKKYILKLRGAKIEDKSTQETQLPNSTQSETSKAKATPAESSENRDVVDKAKKLFGDIVKVKDENK
ncbi:DNA polymerase III subunit gamma/tau [Oenococcus oeni]|uniref:DNA polymerase III subunit gamma/tau n=1 Tax=Oenococcus oeni TaxID=1247 RepID=UPI000277B69A|nr:DNA polymerase III subunit gamma/tau [Oenococcus oeni]EJO04835.1 DNA polymerase III, gamma/tau subunit [Oenococcus oeni AWRIB548]EJO08240.1 DNA polymerase III, gamma/tau subunit [Oenococcus oeni AWRIB422]KGH67924.1 ATPase AAA [Oenococcus oeni IOEB_B16]OIL79957.1 DNA polymerase III, subunit gamma and tau [Oenococcus oeni]OIL91872.1 DNA polymerase III, subunit gamma and tau [Oenococcus oeni]